MRTLAAYGFAGAVLLAAAASVPNRAVADPTLPAVLHAPRAILAAPPTSGPANRRYRVELDGSHVASFDVEKIQTHDKYDSITLERGVTQDSSFSAWASSASNAPAPNPSAIALQRGVTSDSSFAAWASGIASPPPGARSLSFVTFDEAGHVATSLSYRSCAATAYQALPDLDGGANAVTITSLQLLCRERSISR